MPSPLKPDERVTFFTSAAWPAAAGAWEAEVRGIVFEPEFNRLYAALLRRALRVDEAALTAEEVAIFRERLALFLRDNERGKALPVEIGGRSFTLPRSGANGHFRAVLTLGAGEVAAAGGGVLTVRTPAAAEEIGHFSGTVQVVPDEEAPCVVSDVDDTIKVTSVKDRAALKRNTFCRPFVPVPGMAALYRRWEQQEGARFFYVTSSPWQLYQPLEAFREAHGFPPGPWHMKHVRLKSPGTIAALFRRQHGHKLDGIRPLLARWPRRPFVLVGDSADRDPEIYAQVATEFPGRVRRVLIRDVDGTAEARCAAAFRDTPGTAWEIFTEPPSR